ncbi:sigma-54-dependent transcriptional regulator [Pyrinomonas methylaliphatogenes]|jgi:DNA-binding NtrC family response regulator|uniref:Response regulator with CheY-like receiver, AAA-type ATPase, and DNA-binding domains n=1 Tax=Pyrinomonas methylaliphatogenes TaxID=454194 RepID=A0A0B6WW57_9BACT|nr:sigma-54 dependent transcriptional regulator [Pyrinomonas methylaliphatogenes]MBX5478918.1 sigma-54-dependent Fis family transcriptional regulator [Pyrinomonas methylaliphatogenes]CDM64504.1 response regulator with CheY-like receiver, AAA-type ATPase, and DNA-binding domains [Pyrinomonas methylaliphatogenes]
MQRAKLLVVEDEANLRLVLQKELERMGHEVHTAADGEAALRALEEESFDVLLCDINMPRMNGMELLRRVRERANPPEVIMLTGYATVETAVEAMKLGAYDYLTKPYRIVELDALVRQAAEKRHLRVDNQRLRAQLARQAEPWPIIYVSAAMRECLRLVERVAQSDVSVLITGESGTGKELIAHEIHRLSARREGAFVDLNCAALPSELIESELFGYEAGAFSGAKGRKLGLFELADGGTLFLDEVAELPPSLQSKLLRAIETRSFYRVGGVRKVHVDVRVIAATNRDLNALVGDGGFRPDLLYRINGFQINLPPLRERPEDIVPIARHLLKQLGGSNPPELTDEALIALQRYHWPGNVRQLRNCLERAVILANEGRITVNELPPEVVGSPPSGVASVSPSNSQPPPRPVTAPLHEVERQQILAALEQTGWHRGKAAELLGISPSTLYRRLRDYKLTRRL